MSNALKFKIPRGSMCPVFEEIDNLLLKILLFDDYSRTIDKFLYRQDGTGRISKGAKNYILAVLERAEYKLKKDKKYAPDSLESYQICIIKIQKYIQYIKNLK